MVGCMQETPATLTTGRVVFLVVAAAAPMAAMVGNVPLALIRGDGIGLPAAFVIAAAVLLCFCAGYAAMTRLVANGGAFYLLIARALGKPAGAASAYVAIAGYAGNAMGVGAAFGYFSSLVLGSLGLHVPWWAGWAVATAIVAALGYRNIDVSAKVVGILMALEFGVLIVLDFLVIGQQGTAAFPAASFAPRTLLTGSLAISVMFAFTSFIGFESAALYGEETRDPGRAIPRAAYTAVSVIGVFYVLTSWLLIGGAGGRHAPALAKQETGNFVFALAQHYGGTLLYDASAVLLCTSVLACTIALHNAAARYVFALGREGVLPSRLGHYHRKHQSPHVASLALTAATIVIVGALGLTGASPYLVIATSLVGIGTLGIILLQAGTALSVVVFFWRRADRTPRSRILWSGIIAPAIAFGGLGSGFILATVHYSTLTGSTNRAVDLVPLLLIAAGIAGVAVSLRQRARRPAEYAAFAVSRLRGRTVEAAALPAVDYQRRYVLVGGGPAGMVMARALMREGVPFDWFERLEDFGGIWDIDAPGSPMYESAEFISSKYTNGFYGQPMPEDFPDYPSWRQVRDYIRAFGRDWGLDRKVTFGVSVEHAEPLPGDRWKVTLDTGESREYDGLICAPGINWHPRVPVMPGQDAFEGELRHSVTYRSPDELRGKKVLIVGAGNSGVDIACDAARSAARAWLSVRRGYRYIPKHVGGVPTDAVVAGVLEPPRGIALDPDLNKAVDSLVGDLTRYGLPAPDHDVLASHPIMNTEVIERLAEGTLAARPDVDHCTRTGVVFRDGTSEDVDVILLCTGYEYRLPFLDPGLFEWKDGHPRLYLNVFNREHDSLYVLGFIEFADGAAYKRFDEMAQLIVMDIRARETGEHRDAWHQLKASDDPDLSGGIAYIDSPRHASYVETGAYTGYLAGLRDRFGWPDPGDRFYDGVRPAPTQTESARA